MSRNSRQRLSYGPCLQSTGDLPGDQQSMSPVCALCEVSRPHMSIVSTWQSMQARDITSWSVWYNAKWHGLSTMPRWCVSSCCKSCSHTPSWEKRKDLKKCCVKECQNNCFAHNKTTDRNTMKKPWSSNWRGGNTNSLCSQHHYIIIMSGAKRGSTDCAAQSMDLRFARRSTDCLLNPWIA